MRPGLRDQPPPGSRGLPRVCAEGQAAPASPGGPALKQEPCQLRPLSSFYIFFTGGFLPKRKPSGLNLQKGVCRSL